MEQKKRIEIESDGTTDGHIKALEEEIRRLKKVIRTMKTANSRLRNSLTA